MKDDLLKKIWKLCSSPQYRFLVLGTHGFYHSMPDEEYIKKKFKYLLGTDLNLDDPHTFNEKLQWLKLHDHNPEYTIMVDKYAAKKWAADRIGEEYIVPTLGVWNRFDDINFDSLPDRFVLKCTHDSGGVVIVSDKSRLDRAAAKRRLERSLKRNYYWSSREWPYKNVRPRIIAETYLEDRATNGLNDYKIFNFDGEPKLIEVDYDRFVEHKRNLYSADWRYIEAVIQYPPDPAHQIPEPETLDKMLELAAALSEGFPHVRTDFYSIDGRIYFGELTLYPDAGFAGFDPPALGEQMGEWLRLPSGGYLLRNDGSVLYIHRSLGREGLSPIDYKIFCFDGVPKIIMTVHGGHEREDGAVRRMYDPEWNLYEVGLRGKEWVRESEPRPECLEQMLQLAEKLSAGLKHVRTDFYIVNGHIYFGELTFYHMSGMETFLPAEYDGLFGMFLDIDPLMKKQVEDIDKTITIESGDM